MSTLDLSPTFLDDAGARAALTQHGPSLRPFMERDDASRDLARSEWELLPGRVGVSLSLRTVRTATDKLTLALRSGEGELDDLVNAPHEMEHRFHDPAETARRKEREEMIHARPRDEGPIHEAVGTA